MEENCDLEAQCIAEAKLDSHADGACSKRLIMKKLQVSVK